MGEMAGACRTRLVQRVENRSPLDTLAGEKARGKCRMRRSSLTVRAKLQEAPLFKTGNIPEE